MLSSVQNALFALPPKRPAHQIGDRDSRQEAFGDGSDERTSSERASAQIALRTDVIARRALNAAAVVNVRKSSTALETCQSGTGPNLG